MASVLSLVVLASFVVAAWGCAVPFGGCRLDICSGYSGVSVSSVVFPGADYTNPETWKKGSLPLIAYYLGRYNPTVNGGSYNRAGIKDTPGLNLERFDLETNKINPATGKPYARKGSAGSIAGCCAECAATTDCYLYQFFPAETPASFAEPGCYLLSGGSQTWDYPQRGTPFSGSVRRQTVGPRATIPLSFVGGRCNGTAGTIGDPHFTGAHGTNFDFNGAVDKSFCLLSDKTVHVNGMFKGYKTAPNSGAEKELRTWIREVALLWKDPSGKSHKLHMVARNGKEQGKGSGFLSMLAMDNVVLPEPTSAGMVVEHLDMSLEFLGTSKPGRVEKDFYRFKVGTTMDLTLSINVARPQMQTEDEAEVHFNLLLNTLKNSDKVHGVLGQTFRDSPLQQAKALRFQELTRILSGPIVADGASGQGFLEGAVSDYLTTSVIDADCRFSVFQSGAAAVN